MALPENEDALVVTANTFAVIDGAKPPRDLPVQGRSSAADLAHAVRELLVRSSTRDAVDDVSAAEALVWANREYGVRMSRYYSQVSALGKCGPAASAVCVRIHSDGTYSWAHTEDVRLYELSNADIFSAVGADISKGVGNEAARREYVLTQIRRGATLDHAVGGEQYQTLMRAHCAGRNVNRSTLNGEESFGRLLQQGRRTLREVRALLMFSDGMSWPVSELEHDDLRTAQELVKVGAERYYVALKQRYDSDPQMTRFIRFKHMDDASSLLIRF